jgi:hypothetical protein
MIRHATTPAMIAREGLRLLLNLLAEKNIKITPSSQRLETFQAHAMGQILLRDMQALEIDAFSAAYIAKPIKGLAHEIVASGFREISCDTLPLPHGYEMAEVVTEPISGASLRMITAYLTEKDCNMIRFDVAYREATTEAALKHA